MISKNSAYAIHFLEELSSLIGLGRETLSEVWERLSEHKAPFRLEHFFDQCYRAGVGSVPMLMLLSIFVGLTMALLTGYQLQRFGIVTIVPAIVSISFTREMGPLFTGIVLALRLGAAYTAELGAMSAGGEVKAIEGMGIGALRYLVTSRFLEIFLLTPSLAVISGIISQQMKRLTGPESDLAHTLKNVRTFTETLNRSQLPEVIKNAEQLTETLKRQPWRPLVGPEIKNRCRKNCRSVNRLLRARQFLKLLLWGNFLPPGSL